jgi:hypothetical protein
MNDRATMVRHRYEAKIISVLVYSFAIYRLKETGPVAGFGAIIYQMMRI